MLRHLTIFVLNCSILLCWLSGSASALTITLEPVNPPIIIPTSGGSFDYTVTLENPDTSGANFDVWIMVQLPNLSWYGPVLGPINLNLPPGGSVTRLRTQAVPASAPSGVYTYEGRVGVYPDSIRDSGGFPFIKQSSGPPDTLWTRTFGGSSQDVGKSVQQTADGGNVIAGYTDSFGAGNYDVYLIRTNGSGSQIWQRTFGGSGADYGNSVQQTQDGGYVIAGETNSFGAGNVYLIRTNANGDSLWSRTYGGDGYDSGRCVRQTQDGGFIIAGCTTPYGVSETDVYLIKTDSMGNQLWSRTFGGTNEDYGSSVQQTQDGGFVIAGYTKSFGAGDWDVYLIKTDASGNEIWQRNLGGSSWDFGQSVQQTQDGGYIISGYTYSFGAGLSDFYLIKTDGEGNQVWYRTFGGIGYEYGRSVQQTQDGGYVIAGCTNSFGSGEYDFYLIKTDASGNESWSTTFGGTSSDQGYGVDQTQDEGYIVAGYTNSFGAGGSDVYLVRLGSEGDVTGFTSTPWLAETETQPEPFSLSQNYPNPFNPITTLTFTLPVAGLAKLEVFDINGRSVWARRASPLSASGTTPTTEYLPAGTHHILFDGSNLPSGVYICRLQAGDLTATGKMVLMK